MYPSAKMTAVAEIPNIEKMKSGKTRVEYIRKSSRFMLVPSTVMFLLISFLMIILGNIAYDRSQEFTYFYKTGNFAMPSVLCVFLGQALIVISLFGFIGSLKESSFMVNYYLLILVVFVSMELILVLVGFILTENQILDNIYVPANRYASDPEVQNNIEFIQRRLFCCGGKSYIDYIGVQFTTNHSTVNIIKEHVNGSLLTIVMPSTCCVNAGEVYCTRMRSPGCEAAIAKDLAKASTAIGVLGILAVFVNVLGIIFAAIRSEDIREMKSQRSMQQCSMKEYSLGVVEAEGQISYKGEQNHEFFEHQASNVTKFWKIT